MPCHFSFFFLLVASEPDPPWICTCTIVYIVGIPLIAVLCSIELVLLAALVVGCARKKRERKRDGEGSLELTKMEPDYATPEFQTRSTAGMELQKNASYNISIIRHRQQI